MKVRKHLWEEEVEAAEVVHQAVEEEGVPQAVVVVRQEEVEVHLLVVAVVIPVTIEVLELTLM